MAVDQFDLDGRIRDIWIHELSSDAVAHFTFGPSYNAVPIWSPDGTRIVFASNRKLYNHIYQKNADGSGPEELIVDLGLVGDQLCWDWSHDGKYLLAHKGPELWSVSMADRQAKPFIQAKWSVRNARFSPDGRWVAYASNETETGKSMYRHFLPRQVNGKCPGEAENGRAGGGTARNYS